jgi:hypothetical protein
MAEVKSIVDVKEMTNEEKLEKKRAYHRAYMKNRRATDENFVTKQRQSNKERKKFLYQNDADFKAKSQEYNRERARNNIQYKVKYEELLEQMKLV